jgi:SSS family solute:Na+ symporter
VISLSSLDIGIIAVYFVVVITLGLWIAKKDRSSEADFFVAGNKLGWFIIGASLFASNISSEHLIGLAADGFRTGMAVGNYEWFAVIILIVLGTVFVPFYVGNKIRTVPEYLEKRFGPGARNYLSLLTIIANILIRISVALYAGAVVLEQMFGLDMWTSVFILAVTTVLYTSAGGLKAVVYTDTIQSIILLIGTTAITWIALDKVGGFSGLREALPPEMFKMIKPADDPEMPWTGLVVGVPILGLWYWCTDQVIVQRVLGAKNIHQARMGSLFAALLKLTPVFLFVLPGLCARVLFPDIEAKAAFPTLVTELLPNGLVGLVAAALIAALMSSIDSTLNSTGTLVSLDFYQKKYPNASSAEIVRSGRITMVTVMIFGMIWVAVVAKQQSLFQYLQGVNAAISPPVAAGFLMGIFWKRANYPGVLAAFFGGLVIGLGLMLANEFIDGFSLAFLLQAGVTFACSVLILVVVSLNTAPPTSEQLDHLTWKDASSIIARSTSEGQRKLFLAGSGALILTIIWILYFFEGNTWFN